MTSTRGMQHDMVSGVYSPAVSPKSQQIPAGDRMQGGENHLRGHCRLEAGFELGAHTQTGESDETLHLQQRRDSITQLWSQFARGKILEIGRLEAENQSLKDQIVLLQPEIEVLPAQDNEYSMMSTNSGQTFHNLTQIQESEEKVVLDEATRTELKMALDLVQKLNMEKKEQECELQHAKRQLSITEENLKGAHLELEVANHHLQLRNQSIATLEAIQNRSSISNIDLFEAEAFVRNDLETQCEDLRSELKQTRNQKEKLETQCGNLRSELKQTRGESEELETRCGNLKSELQARWDLKQELKDQVGTLQANDLETQFESLRSAFMKTRDEKQKLEDQVRTLQVYKDDYEGDMAYMRLEHTKTRSAIKSRHHEHTKRLLEEVWQEKRKNEEKDRVIKRMELEKASRDSPDGHGDSPEELEENRSKKKAMEDLLESADEIVSIFKKQVDDLNKKYGL